MPQQHTVTSSADSGVGSLRAAIAQAQSGDTIVLDAALAGATLTLQSQLEISPGQNITLDGRAAAGFTISGNQKHRLIQVNSNQDFPTQISIKTVTLANGYTPDRGGAIATTHQGEVTVENVQFRNNVANKGGGAIFTAYEGRLTVLDSAFTNNRATAGNDERGAGAIAFWGPNELVVKGSSFISNEGINGGAINSLNGKLTIEDTLFRNNKTTAAKYDTGNPRPFLRGFGGAIYTDRASTGSDATAGTIRISDSTFEGNQGRGEGGAAYLYTGTQDQVIIEDSRFEDNRVIALPNGGNGGNGGAVVQMNNGLNKGFTVSNTLFANNTATGQGGGIWAMDADMRVTNSTFSGNETLGQTGSSIGGGLALYSPTDIVGSTFTNNNAGWVGGAIAASKSDRVTVKGSIFTDNTADNGPNDWGIQQHTNRELVDLGNNVQYPPKQTNNFNDYNVTASIRIGTEESISGPSSSPGNDPAPSENTADGSIGGQGNTPNPNENTAMDNASNTFAQEVLRLTNEFRAEQGSAPVTLNQKLAQAAQGHSVDMATQDFFSHTAKDGDTLTDRVKQVEYSYRNIGENIAAGQSTPEAVVAAWKKSPGHRANMLNPQFAELGVGYYNLKNDTGSVNYNRYWTQVFGRQSGSPAPTEPVTNETSSPTTETPPPSEPVAQPKPEISAPKPKVPQPPQAEVEVEVAQPKPEISTPKPQVPQLPQPEAEIEVAQPKPEISTPKPKVPQPPQPEVFTPEPSGYRPSQPEAEVAQPIPKVLEPKLNLMTTDGFFAEAASPDRVLNGPMLPRGGNSASNPTMAPLSGLESGPLSGSLSGPLSGLESGKTMWGGPGRDIMAGSRGNDAVWGKANKDRLSGRRGNDKLYGGSGDDTLKGGKGRDRLWGNAGNDRLRGSGGDDKLRGGRGHDRLYGGGGSDRLYGGAGQDILVGSGRQTSPQRDYLSGGEGGDRFVLGNRNRSFYGVDADSHAVILDFDAAESDRIVLHGAAEDYRLGSATAGDHTGTGIFTATSSFHSSLVALVAKETVTLDDIDFVSV